MNTGITHALMALALAGVIWRKKDLRYFRESRTSFEAVWAQTKSFIRYGIPSALQILIEFAALGQARSSSAKSARRSRRRTRLPST